MEPNPSQLAFASEYDVSTSIRNNNSIGNNAGIKTVVGDASAQSTQSPVSPAGNIQSSTLVGYNSGVGWWIGFDVDGIPKLFIGNSKGNKILWDGTSLTINGNLVIGGLIVTVGPTDNLQTAVNLLNTNGGGELYLKAGTYTQNTPIVGTSSINIIGISPSQTIIDFNHTSSNLTFAGTNIYTTGTITSIGGGVNVTGSGTSWLANASAGQCLFLGTRWYTIAAVTSDTTLILAEAYGDNVAMPGASYRIASVLKDFKVSNVTLKNSTGTALVVSDSRQFNLNDVVLLFNNVGYSATNVSEQAINQLISVGNTSDGVQWTNVGLSQAMSLNVIGNGGNGITMNNVKTVDISPIAADENAGDGINVTLGVNIVLLVEAVGNGGQGIELVSGCDNIDIYNGTIQNNISDGIKFTATDTNCHVYACSITGNGGYGANVATSSDVNTIFTTNNFASNASGAINDAGTNTLVRGNTGVQDNATSSFSSIGLYGNGSTGSVVISTNTTLAADMYYVDLTINSGVTLQTGGYKIYCSGTLTNNGTISNNGGDGGSSPGAGSVTGGTAGAVAPGVTTPAGKPGKVGAAGVSGTVVPTYSNGNAGNAGDSANPSLGVSGSAGGAGGADTFGQSGGSGGAAGTATAETISESIPAFTASGVVSAGVEKVLTQVISPVGSTSGATLSNSAGSGSGGSGGGGTSNTLGSFFTSGGGGSGASGGFVFIIAKIIVISATGIISANGGNGGSAGTGTQSLNATIGGSGGGAGGSGGVIFMSYQSFTNSGAVTVTGGAGGGGSSQAGGGNNGTAGTAGLTGNVYKVKLTTT